MFSQADHHHMARALQAAESVRHLTRENPRVGAVVVQADSVVGVGATQPQASLMPSDGVGPSR